jgi:hypothetical protein
MANLPINIIIKTFILYIVARDNMDFPGRPLREWGRIMAISYFLNANHGCIYAFSDFSRLF